MYKDLMKIPNSPDDPDNHQKAHYMTITGLEKYWNPSEKKYKYAMKIVSWGSVYYADLSSYMAEMDYFTNYLSVY